MLRREHSVQAHREVFDSRFCGFYLNPWVFRSVINWDDSCYGLKTKGYMMK